MSYNPKFNAAQAAQKLRDTRFRPPTWFNAAQAAQKKIASNRRQTGQFNAAQAAQKEHPWQTVESAWFNAAQAAQKLDNPWLMLRRDVQRRTGGSETFSGLPAP